MKIDCQLDYQTILRNQGRPVHLSLTLKANPTSAQRPRPMAFCAVIDRSGSMGGPPLDQAKKACRVMVRNLHPEDFFSIVLFETTAEVLLPLQKVGDRRQIYDLIDKIETAGSTNLMGGWMLAQDELKKSPTDRNRRLLLLSDGFLNHGIQDPDQIRMLAQNGLQKHGIRTSTLGFGNSYDESLMSLLADSTNGVFYDASSPDLLPGIFQAELEGLQLVAAQNVRVRVTTKTFCESFVSLSSYPSVNLPDGRTEFQLGDLTSEESSTLVLQLEVLPLPTLPEGEPVASLEGEELLGVEILWDDLSSEVIASKTYERLVRISGTENPEDVRQNTEIISKIATQKVGKVIQQTETLLVEGHAETAKRLLQDTIDWINVLGDEDTAKDCLPILTNALSNLNDWGKLDSRTLKDLHYIGVSFRKMRSHATWTSKLQAPSFSRRSVSSESTPGKPEERSSTESQKPRKTAKSLKSKKPKKSTGAEGE
jgi:Ca-activated chloride channel family protein